MKRGWERLKHIMVSRVLGVSDTPHRIAWGVLLGFMVAWTPTIGLQIVMYVAIATLLRANKVSGIPFLFISNPVTAVPVYYLAWKVGALVLSAGEVSDGVPRDLIRSRLARATASEGFWTRILSAEFWRDMVAMAVDMGAEIWLGSLLLGIATGVPAYFLSYWGVRAYRRRHMGRLRRTAPEGEGDPAHTP